MAAFASRSVNTEPGTCPVRQSESVVAFSRHVPLRVLCWATKVPPNEFRMFSFQPHRPLNLFRTLQSAKACRQNLLNHKFEHTDHALAAKPNESFYLHRVAHLHRLIQTVSQFSGSLKD